MSDTYIGNTPAGADKWHADTPIGAIMAWPNSQLPLGWLECNGQATTQYPDLLALIGSTVPDLRGEFIRGFDNGKGTDIGRALGTSQTDELKAHIHGTDSVFQNPVTSSGAWGNSVQGITDPEFTANVNTDSTGGVETRPKNVALKYIIKAFNVLQTGEVTSYLPSNKNYIINPTFSINQRGFAGGALADGIYGFDRWKASGGNSVSLVDASGYITVTGGYLQVVEAFGYTGDVTLTWEGTATMRIDAGGDVTSPHTFSMDGSTNHTIKIVNGTAKNVKLELGGAATLFEYPDTTTELPKCQRYYWQGRIDGGGWGFLYGNGVSTNISAGGATFPVLLRTAPTMTTLVAPTVTNCTAINLSVEVNGFVARVTVTAAGNYRAGGGVYTADAEL